MNLMREVLVQILWPVTQLVGIDNHNGLSILTVYESEFSMSRLGGKGKLSESKQS